MCWRWFHFIVQRVANTNKQVVQSDKFELGTHLRDCKVQTNRGGGGVTLRNN